MKNYLLITCLWVSMALQAQVPVALGTVFATRQTPVHDPVMAKEGDTYYVYCTGFGISVFSSKDLKNWKKEPAVFSKAPEWAQEAISGFKGHIWAPDISFHNGQYYLYYAVSAFGKNTSCIGVAVNKTLNPSDTAYHWEDKGKVVQSVPGRDQWNAIDPNLIIDENNNPWLVFGSFWEGLKMVRLNQGLCTVAEPQEWYTVARRPRDFNIPDSLAGNAAIEAPFVFKKDKYYYLFASWDYCCRMEKSNYKIVVGRSDHVQGPYLDKNGIPMNENGGSLVVEGDQKKWFGVGHCSAYHFDNVDYLVYHGYDANDKGRSKLIIRQINWDQNGWPVLSTEKD